MTTSVVTFNGSVNATPGVSVSHTRAWATVDGAGQAVAANTLAYAAPGLAITAGTSIIVDDNTSPTLLNHCCYGSDGKWSDGTPACVRTFLSDADNTVNVSIFINVAIAANCFKANSARNVQIRWLTGADASWNPGNWKNTQQDLLKGANATTGYLNAGTSGEDANWYYSPANFLVENGCILAYCAAVFNNAGTPQTRAMAICWWDDSATGSNKWQLLIRTPSVQNGAGRTASWGCTAACQLPSDPLTRYVPFVDYRDATVSTGGEVWLMKLTRDTITAKFVPGLAVPIYHIENMGVQTHAHGVSMTPYGAGGLALTVDWGDGGNSRTITITRNDAVYDQGYANPGTTTPGAVTFSAPTIVHGSNAAITNATTGYTTHPDTAGDPDASTNAINFTAATWNDGTRALGHAAFDITSIGNMTGALVVLATGAGVVASSMAVVASHATTVLTLDRAGVATNGAIDVAGFLSRGLLGLQPVARASRYGTPDMIFGSDEVAGAALIKASTPPFTNGDNFLAYSIIPGRGMFSAYGAMSAGAGASKATWNTFVSASCGADFAGPMAFVSDQGVALAGDPSLSRVMYMKWGVDLAAAMFFPGVARPSQTQACWYTDPATGKRWLLFGPDFASQITAIPEPESLVVRPAVFGHLAVTNKMLATTVDKSATILTAQTAGSTYTVKTNADLATMIPGHVIPPPPCSGEMARVTANSPVAFIREVTGSGAEGLAFNVKFRLTFYVYVLPPANDGSVPPYQQASMVPTWVLSQGTWTGIVPTNKTAVFGAGLGLPVGGWIPITLECAAPNTWTAGGTTVWSGNNVLQISEWFQPPPGNRYQPRDYLVAFDSIVAGATTDIPVLSAPQSTGVATTSPLAITPIVFPTASGANWTHFVRMQMAPNGADSYTTGRPANSYLFTLKDASGHFWKFKLDGTVTDESGHQLISTNSNAGMRGDWINMCIRRSATGPVSTLFWGVGSDTDAGAVLNALSFTTMTSGDQNGANPEHVLIERAVVVDLALSNTEILARMGQINFGESLASSVGWTGRVRERLSRAR